MNKVLPWLVLLALIVITVIYLLGKLSESRTDQFYARAHLVEAKSDARQDYINTMMPILYMVTIVVVMAGATVTVIALIIGGVLGLRHFESRDRPGLDPPITLVQIGSGQKQKIYQMISAGKIIDVSSERHR